jgi:hypothetical protein
VDSTERYSYSQLFFASLSSVVGVSKFVFFVGPKIRFFFFNKTPIFILYGKFYANALVICFPFATRKK